MKYQNLQNISTLENDSIQLFVIFFAWFFMSKDLVDSDALLDEDDLKKPDPLSLKSKLII